MYTVKNVTTNTVISVHENLCDAFIAQKEIYKKMKREGGAGASDLIYVSGQEKIKPKKV